MDFKIKDYLRGIPVLASTGIASIRNRIFPSSTPVIPATTSWGRTQKLVSLTTDAKIICSNPSNPNHWPSSATITATWEQMNFYADGTSQPASFIWPPVGVLLEKDDPDHAAEFIDNVVVANPSGTGMAQLVAEALPKDARVTVKARFEDYIQSVTVTVKAA